MQMVSSHATAPCLGPMSYHAGLRGQAACQCTPLGTHPLAEAIKHPASTGERDARRKVNEVLARARRPLAAGVQHDMGACTHTAPQPSRPQASKQTPGERRGPARWGTHGSLWCTASRSGLPKRPGAGAAGTTAGTGAARTGAAGAAAGTGACASRLGFLAWGSPGACCGRAAAAAARRGGGSSTPPPPSASLSLSLDT
jgi:molecular chaperone DnaK